jgi:hypothetical protein
LEATDIANLLAESKAQISNLAEHQGLGEDVMVRFWLVNQEDLEGCVAYLKAMTTVTDPMAGTRWARSGTWYAGAVDYKPGNSNPLVVSGAAGLVWILYQQLSKGDKIITITESCAAYTKTKIIHTYNALIPSGAAGAGQIINVDAQPTALGRERTVQETIVPKDQVATAYDRSKASDAAKVLHTENATPLTQPADVKGTIVRQSAQPTEAGNDRTVVETIVPKDQVATAYDRSKAADAAKVLHTENGTPLTQPADVKGTIVRQSAQPTEAGNDRTVVETIVPKDQVATGYDRSKAADATKVVHTENGTPLTQPADVKGTIVRQSAQPTEAGNDRTVVETIVPKDQVATGYDRSKAADATKVVHTENATPLTQPADVKGTIVRQSAQPTEAGNDRTVVETIVPKDQDETSYEENAFESATEVLHTENDSPLSEPTPEAGKIKTNQNLPTEAGNTRTQEKVRTAIAQTTTFASIISDDATETIEKGHNAAAMPEIEAVEGADVTIDGDINSFQKYDYVRRLKTANVPLSCPGIVSWPTYGNDYRINNWQWSSTEQKFYYTSYWIYRERIFHGIAFYLTAAEAAAALPTICAEIGGVNVGYGSAPSKAGNNLWLATVHSRSDLLISTTTGLDPVWE